MASKRVRVMSVTEVLEQRGMGALLRLVAVILAVVAIQLLKLPLLFTARVLEFAQQRLNQFVVAGLPARPAGDGGVSP